MSEEAVECSALLNGCPMSHEVEFKIKKFSLQINHFLNCSVYCKAKDENMTNADLVETENKSWRSSVGFHGLSTSNFRRSIFTILSDQSLL